MVRGSRKPSSRAARGRPLGLLSCASALAAIAATGVLPRAAPGYVTSPTRAEPVVGVSGDTSPGKLPRSRAAPATLRLGFTSAAPGTTSTPELSEIRFEVSRDVVFQTAGLPSCPITELYSETSNANETCAGSLVGHGTVISEVTLPGQAPVTIEGHLSAFYDLAGSQPLILAQVISTGALPLTYVLPFAITRHGGPFATVMSVRHMQFIAGECAKGHPDCFSQTYTYKGIYGRISKFELTLSRRFVHAGKPASLVSAGCPARRGTASATFPLAEVVLDYSFPEEGAVLRQASRRCEVLAPRRGLRSPHPRVA